LADREREAAIERLIEIEEVRRDEDGVAYWRSCGEPLSRP
jgi:hypothetical protein